MLRLVKNYIIFFFEGFISRAAAATSCIFIFKQFVSFTIYFARRRPQAARLAYIIKIYWLVADSGANSYKNR